MAEIGRPSTYDETKAIAICEKIASSSWSMKTICEELEIPLGTVLGWLSKNQDFQENYARAKEMQADYLAEEIMEIADDGTNDFMTIKKGDEEYTVENKEWTSRSKLRVDARKWAAGKLKPKKYGDKIEIDNNFKTGDLPPWMKHAQGEDE